MRGFSAPTAPPRAVHTRNSYCRPNLAQMLDVMNVPLALDFACTGATWLRLSFPLSLSRSPLSGSLSIRRQAFYRRKHRRTAAVPSCRRWVRSGTANVPAVSKASERVRHASGGSPLPRWLPWSCVAAAAGRPLPRLRLKRQTHFHASFGSCCVD